MGQEIITLSGTPDFTPIGKFMISSIHYIYITECVSLRTYYMYVYGLMTLGCLPGLVWTAFSWTYIILPSSGQWMICNKQFHYKRAHTSGALNLNFRIYLQGGFNQVCMNILQFLFGLCVRVDYMLYQISHWLNDTRMVHAWRSIWFKRNKVLKWNAMLKIHISIFLRDQYFEWTHHWVWISS